MKCYVETKEAKDSFVLRYEKKNSLIWIYYASGQIGKIKNTLENERQVLCFMRKQVEEAKSKLDQVDEQLKNNELIKRATGGVALGMAMGLLLQTGQCNTMHIGLLGALCGVNLITHFRSALALNVVEDIQKNDLFLQNEELINEVIVDRPDYFPTLDEFLEEDIVGKEQPPLTLNDMDKYTYEEIRLIADGAESKHKLIKNIDNFKK